MPSGNTLSYEAIEPESGETFSVHEQFIAPGKFLSTRLQDRLLNNQLDKIGDFQLRFQTLTERARYQASNTSGLIGARTSLLSHQLFVASEVGRRLAPKYFLLTRLALERPLRQDSYYHSSFYAAAHSAFSSRFPDPLLHQWLVEMLRRFNLQFSIYDDARFEAEEGAFDFGNDQLVLSPWSFIKHNDTARMLLLESDWDFVIVDEAHHLNLGEEAQDELDVTLTQLARTSRGLLLLTATPGQSGVDSHFSRLQLLDPDRFSDLDKFTEEQRQFEQTYELIERLRAGE